MAQLTIRKVDDRTYARLKRRAERNKRSLEAEIRLILDQAVSDTAEESAKRAREDTIRWLDELRSKQEPLPEGTIVRWIREGRDGH